MVWSGHPPQGIWLGENGYSILFTFSTIVNNNTIIIIIIIIVYKEWLIMLLGILTNH